MKALQEVFNGPPHPLLLAQIFLSLLHTKTIYTDSEGAALQAVFNGLLIRFIMFHPLAGVDERMCITGGHPAFGSWGQPEEWLEMGLGNVRTLLTNELGVVWGLGFRV